MSFPVRPIVIFLSLLLLGELQGISVLAQTAPTPEPSAVDSAVVATPTLQLKDGTLVRVRTLSTVTSRDAKTGDEVRFSVANDVVAGDMIVIRKGAPALGHVAMVKKKRRMGRPGQLAIKVDSVKMIDEKQVPLRVSEKKATGIGHQYDIVDASIRTLGLGTPVLLLFKGEDADIPAFTTVAAYVDGGAVLDQSQVSSLQPPPKAPTGLATIYILRSHHDGEKAPSIYCGAFELGQLRGGHYLELQIPPGEYLFQSPGIKQTAKVKAEAEEAYYIQFYPRSFLYNGYMSLLDALAGDDLLAFPRWHADPKLDLSNTDLAKLRDTSRLPEPPE